MTYYSNVNLDLLSCIPINAKCILEVGCGTGHFARAFLKRNPVAQYVGVELFKDAAREAAGFLSHVVIGDIENEQILAELDEIRGKELFEILIFGDVLEHLHSPRKVLEKLRSRIMPSGLCVACIPNVAHWSVLQQQLRGRWDYVDSGLLDRTHLRFFTLETAVELFQKAGWTVLDAKARILWPEKTASALNTFAPLADKLGIAPEKLRRDLSAFQWIIRAVNGTTPTVISIGALGLNKIAGVTEVRVDHPMTALSTLPTVKAVWGAGRVTLPPDWSPGVLVLHRQFMNDAQFNVQIEHKIAQRWVIVADIDDDPHHWKESIETDFYAYKAVHAVTVSTEPLAEMIRQWNPNVQIFHNAIFELPPVSSETPKQGERLRIFFGALNRENDWSDVLDGIVAAVDKIEDTVQFVVVHDKAFFDALPDGISKEFHPTLPYDHYMAVLTTCDVALLPLSDNPFNRSKSDLKFIECCAAGVVPICSPVVYAERSVHHKIGSFATTSDEWQQALTDVLRRPEEISRRRALGLAYVKRERMHCHQLAAREEYYQRLLMQRDSLETERQARLKMYKLNSSRT
ncbi:MAG: bifunctional 3-demethylubiquinone-9 3-methyltransferase/ 2-octaprenyl-6-hydroxy phenol methylase [Syntrophus sp. PtaB.Bin001]|nr:MAG: bifunctional 3-demethylubiquinone-9 3-methyltransferase/ 2-octaprenyl-6-hydroxy phenol methylase [Syntrophus sp. PtaB.Bin001]